MPDRIPEAARCQRHPDRRGWPVSGSLVFTRLCEECRDEFGGEWTPAALAAQVALASSVPGGEADRLARRALEREVVDGVERFTPGQHHATIEARDVPDFFDPAVRGDVGRMTFVDLTGHLWVILAWRETGAYWKATWIGRVGMHVSEPARPAPDGYELSDALLAALRAADDPSTATEGETDGRVVRRSDQG